MAFSVTLLNQFIEDMEAYAEVFCCFRFILFLVFDYVSFYMCNISFIYQQKYLLINCDPGAISSFNGNSKHSQQKYLAFVRWIIFV